MEQGIQDGTKEAGVEYFLQAVDSDQAAEPQLNTSMNAVVAHIVGAA